MTPFEKAIAFTLDAEGGYVFDPNDPGGETKFGISKRQYPVLDIKTLLLEDAKKIYKRDYWEASKAHLLPEKLAIVHFDTAVNHGVVDGDHYIDTANELLQAILCVKVDGIIGPQTLNQIDRYVKLYGEDYIVKLYLERRARLYLDIVRAKPKMHRYINGWMNRLDKLSTYLGVNFAIH